MIGGWRRTKSLSVKKQLTTESIEFLDINISLSTLWFLVPWFGGYIGFFDLTAHIECDINQDEVEKGAKSMDKLWGEQSAEAEIQ